MDVLRGLVGDLLVWAARIALRCLYGPGMGDWAAVVEDDR